MEKVRTAIFMVAVLYVMYLSIAGFKFQQSDVMICINGISGACNE